MIKTNISRDTVSVIVDSPVEYLYSEFTISAYHNSPLGDDSFDHLWCCVVDGRLIFPSEGDSTEA